MRREFLSRFIELLTAILLLSPLLLQADEYGRGYCDAMRHRRDSLLQERNLEAKRLSFPLNHEEHLAQIEQEELHRDKIVFPKSTKKRIMEEWDTLKIPPSMDGQKLYHNFPEPENWTVECPSGERYPGRPHWEK